MQEMWKGQQVREDATEMHRTDARVGFFWKNREGPSSDLVQKMLGLCKAENEAQTDELPHAGTDGHQRTLARW